MIYKDISTRLEKNLPYCKFIYAGSSWAWSAFDEKNQREKIFSYADVLGKTYYDISNPGCTFKRNLIDYDLQFGYIGNSLPVIWLTTGIDSDFWQGVCEKSNWYDLWLQKQNDYLDKIDQLNVKVLLITAHSCIVPEKKYKNITFFKDSILDFICDISGTTKKLDDIHKRIDWDIAHGQLIYAKNPDRDLVNSVHEGLLLYEELEKKGLFSGVHPNIKSVSLFGQKYKKDILKWVDTNYQIN